MKHLSLRLAWHDNGWNGTVCKNPKANIYCTGRYSYERGTIVDDKDIDIEMKYCGGECNKTLSAEYIVPCCFSVNAFGKDEIKAYRKPPSFFKDDTETKIWTLPPATACVWPYEEMYKDDVKNEEGKADSSKRSEAMREYFRELKENKSLVFYYANYDNPYSGDEKKYVIVGVSRLKSIGEELKWDNQSDKSYKRYGNLVWGRMIQSKYPDEGFRIPYEKFKDNQDDLEKILMVPENSRNFKYGTRHISDDDALDLIERLIEVTSYLKKIGDTTEAWDVRLKWLASIMNELWNGRGIYPGLYSVLDYLQAEMLIPECIKLIKQGVDEKKIYQDVVNFFNNNKCDYFNKYVNDLDDILDEWLDKDEMEKRLLLEVLPRFDLTKDQVENIMDTKRENVSIYSSLEEIVQNPYILCEEYIGLDQDDTITFNKIDHGMFPNPDLGREAYIKTKDTNRFRALIVDTLKKMNQHSFVDSDIILEKVNSKLNFMPAWKKAKFNKQRLKRKEEEMKTKLYFKEKGDSIYIYLKDIYDLEKIIGDNIKSMLSRPDIELERPVVKEDWKEYIYDESSLINNKDPEMYNDIVKNRINLCEKLINKPISIISGEAGTGKTTIVTAIIKAIKKSYGRGISFQLLAPTGKAAERLRKATGEDAMTIQSFLAQNNWLNDNLTLKLKGGKVEECKKNIIIDESSMMDICLLGTLFKSLNFNCVQRIIFIGDYNQLPPIGTGKPFVEIINWMNKNYRDNLGILNTNLRAIENDGYALKLASIFTEKINDDNEDKGYVEEILRMVQRGGDIGDLRVLYWNDIKELYELLDDEVMQLGARDDSDDDKTHRLINIFNNDGRKDPDKFQIISPFRVEQYGVDEINKFIQQEFNTYNLKNKGSLGGITYFDKIMQYMNRPKSNPYSKWEAYNFSTRKKESLEVYNGETGFVYPHIFDKGKWEWNKFRFSRYQVQFKGKDDFKVQFDSDKKVKSNIELAYAISVHKAQGSEFDNVIFILPNKNSSLLSRELFYTGITRAQVHTTLLIEKDIEPLLKLRRKENSANIKINSSVMEFKPIPIEFIRKDNWYEEGKIHKTLVNIMVRSKSEAIIANMLFAEDISFEYEKPLYGKDGTMYLPDFTIKYNGEEWYWEHLGLKGVPSYDKHWKKKEQWYKENGLFSRLYTTEEVKGADTKKWLEGFYRMVTDK